MLTIDIRAYQRTYAKERRELAKRLGICCSCNSDPAEPGRTKCKDCSSIQNQQNKERRQLKKLTR